MLSTNALSPRTEHKLKEKNFNFQNGKIDMNTMHI